MAHRFAARALDEREQLAHLAARLTATKEHLMEITADQLLAVIGKKQVEIELLQARIGQLESELRKLETHHDDEPSP